MVTASVVEHGPAVSVSGFHPKTPQKLLSTPAFEESVTYKQGLIYIFSLPCACPREHMHAAALLTLSA